MQIYTITQLIMGQVRMQCYCHQLTLTLQLIIATSMDGTQETVLIMQVAL